MLLGIERTAFLELLARTARTEVVAADFGFLIIC